MLIWVVLWMSMSTAYFLRVQDMIFDPERGTMTVQRVVLSHDDLLAHWRLVVQLPPGVRLLDGRSECADDGESIFEPRYVDGSSKTEAVVLASPEVLPCLMVPEAQIVASFQVIWAGVIPLKPTYFFKPPRKS
jgi:hypothetical protein